VRNHCSCSSLTASVVSEASARDPSADQLMPLCFCRAETISDLTPQI
jgi:hypothetical protein